ncbi:AbrB/MazE/SpoVT family DNA-binding domain-containing protein [bacterium]|nr:AbrB/MazE/SpoVT family DNA-binding domain-containing protein [candidate division CSSED10-310 bacterium]
MKTRIVKIGNSQGIRIPKPILDQTGLKEEVEISIENDALVIRSLTRARSGWDQIFAEMRECGDDNMLDSMDELDNEFDEKDWEWK